jgi:pilus assembly protein CpaC
MMTGKTLRVRRWGRLAAAALVVALGLVGENAFAQDRAAAPVAPPGLKAKVNDLVEDITESEVELEVNLRRSKLLRTKLDIMRVAVADPATVEIVAYGTREVEVIGKQTGTTSLTVWLGNEQETRILSVLVSVTHDTAVDDRRRMEYGELQTMINEMFPDSKVQLIPIADKLVVKGEARDIEECTRILSVLRKNGGGGGGGSQGLSQSQASEPFPEAGQLPESNLISLLEVPGEHQIVLKVQIAELKRSAVRRFGARFDLQLGDLFFNSLIGGAGSFIASQTFNDASFNLFVEALASNGYAKILAEPKLVTLSGRPATFLAGGEFAVPTVVGVGGVQAVSTSFKGFGTSLSFTPTVLDKDRIRLNVSPTFSTINPANSVQGIFGLDTRSTSTTVDLREGQTLALAGLIQEQQRGDKGRVPWIGDLPVVGALFGSQSVSRDETELVILVTPELVHPMEPDQVPGLLPGMEVTEPDDVEFYLFRRTEGDPNAHHRSTVWPNYRDRRCHGTPGLCIDPASDYFMSGPHGFSQ